MTSTDHLVAGPPAWPGCALAAWACAWAVGRCAPDDVADTLTGFAILHQVADPAGVLPAGTLTSPTTAVADLLRIVRRAAGYEVRLPVAGHPCGLPPGPATDAAMGAGEIVLLHQPDGSPTIGLVPMLVGEICRWTVHEFPGPLPEAPNESLGQVEYDLRAAVAETATLIGDLGTTASTRRPDPGGLRKSLTALVGRHHVDLPPHDDRRAGRVIDSAARVEAIVSLAGAHAPAFGVTARDVDSGDTRLRGLISRARSARAEAVNAVIREFS